MKLKTLNLEKKFIVYLDILKLIWGIPKNMQWVYPWILQGISQKSA